MSEVFKAFDDLNPVVKRHTVTIQGKTLEVTLDKKLEIMRVGEDKYLLNDGKIRLRPRSKTSRRFATLAKARIGYIFRDDNPLWVDRIDDGGAIWQIESE